MTNIVILAGNLGADPESRSTASGTNITTFRLATSRLRYRDGKIVRDEKGRGEQITEWHRITCFNGLAKTVQEHCQKGMTVLVEGSLHYSKWTDRDGVERWSTEINAEKVQFLSRGKSSQTRNDEGTGADSDIDDDIPF